MSDRRGAPPSELEPEDLAAEAEASPDELEAAARLRDSLRAAVAPVGLADDVNERLLARALGIIPGPTQAAAPPAADGLADFGEEIAAGGSERRAANQLGERLQRGLRRDADAEPDDRIEALVAVAAALHHAHAPARLDEVAGERALRRASLGPPRRRTSSRGAQLGWGVALAAAAAAAIALLPRTGLVPLGEPATAAWVPARSTQELFDPAEPFPRAGGASDRIDIIAAARRSDLRQNRFARWGIR